MIKLMQTTLLRFAFCVLTPLTPAFAINSHILIMGDSLSAAHNLSPQDGWVALYAKALKSTQWSVINASVSGETLANGVLRLPQLLIKHQPQAVIIELGANDGLQGKSLTDIKKNLLKAITISKAHQVKHIFLVEMLLPPNYGAAYVQQFTNMFHQVAQEETIHLIPFASANILGNPKLIQNDGLHPNKQAQPIINDIVLKATRAILEPL